MTKISPLLQKKLNNNQNTSLNSTSKHQEAYNDLTRRANEAKPNEPKAKLIKENPVQGVVSSLKDTKQDALNFKTATKTGKLNDTGLGRINNLGLKIGGLLIATFLAANSKTKTEAAMKYIGGGAFFASMSLWPKLFINLPARIVHGFPIDQKYISAQGEKKDLYLDNKFVLTDIIPEEDERKYAQRAGIDYDSKNGKEKIQRKMQKTALQNRTLWMATAGFSTPLMTALACDAVEKPLKDAIINHDYKKVKNLADNNQLKETIVNAKPDLSNVAALDKVFKNAENYDDEFFQKLSKTLFDMQGIEEKFRSSDDFRPVEKYKCYEYRIADSLKKFYNDTAIITSTDDLEKVLRKNILKTVVEDTEGTTNNPFFKTMAAPKNIQVPDEDKIKAILSELGEAPTVSKLKELFKKFDINKDVNSITQDLKLDHSNFPELIKSFNQNSVAQSKGRLKAYLDLLNPVAGQRAESKYTQQIENSIKKIFKKADFAANADINSVQASFQEMIKDVEFGSDEYKKLINELMIDENSNTKSLLAKIKENIPFIKNNNQITGSPEEISDVLEKLKEAIPDIKHQTIPEFEELNEALFGEGNGKLLDNLIPKFIQEQKTNANGFIARAGICANFEARLKEGLINVEGFGKLNDNPELLEAARKIVYTGNQSLFENFADIQYPDKKGAFKSLLNAIYDPEAFKEEHNIIKNAADKLLNLNLDSNAGKTEKYLLNLNYVNQIKENAINLFNNKSWKKIFAPMAIALVAITLLVQPLFGNIKKEYEKESKGGSK